MFVLRSLFWFAVVALMMPQGPDLGLDLGRIRSEIAVQHHSISFEAVGASGWRAVAVPLLHRDPVQSFRTAALSRLAAIRVELAQAEARPGVDALIRPFSGRASY